MKTRFNNNSLKPYLISQLLPDQAVVIPLNPEFQELSPVIYLSYNDIYQVEESDPSILFFMIHTQSSQILAAINQLRESNERNVSRSN